MSATIQILKVVKDIDLSQFKTEEDLENFEESHKYKVEIKDDEGNVVSSYNVRKYEFYMFSPYKVYSHRLKKQLREIYSKYKDYFVSVRSYIGIDEEQNLLLYDENHGAIEKYLIVEEILWRQGWFFKKRFFNNDWTIYYAMNRKHMIKLLDQFINVKPGVKDTRGLEAYRACLDTFKDNEDMIFKLAW